MSDVTISPVTDRGMILVRGEASVVGAALTEAIGCAMPGIREITQSETAQAAWMSPDEVLVLLSRETVEPTRTAIGEALAGTHHLVADVSDARALFVIDGPGWRNVLAAGAPVDLHPDVFSLGEIRRTRLGQVACAFWATEQGAELVCFAAVGDFVGTWLETAAQNAAGSSLYAS